jgi:hypothetical protein
MYLLCACCYVRSAFHIFVSNEFSAVVQKRLLRLAKRALLATRLPRRLFDQPSNLCRM